MCKPLDVIGNLFANHMILNTLRTMCDMKKL